MTPARGMMKTRHAVAFSMLAGIAIGAVVIEGIRAQTGAPVYYIVETEVTNLDGYQKEYLPRLEASIKAFGGQILASGTKVASVEGAPPKPRVAIVVWDDVENIQTWRDSPQFKEVRVLGDKVAKFRAFTVEGVPRRR
jgi:uncharacterized protein (DUF1330 family)